MGRGADRLLYGTGQAPAHRRTPTPEPDPDLSPNGLRLEQLPVGSRLRYRNSVKTWEVIGTDEYSVLLRADDGETDEVNAESMLESVPAFAAISL